MNCLVQCLTHRRCLISAALAILCIPPWFSFSFCLPLQVTVNSNCLIFLFYQSVFSIQQTSGQYPLSQSIKRPCEWLKRVGTNCTGLWRLREGFRIMIVLIMVTLWQRVADPGTLDTYSPLTLTTHRWCTISIVLSCRWEHWGLHCSNQILMGKSEIFHMLSSTAQGFCVVHFFCGYLCFQLGF